MALRELITGSDICTPGDGAGPSNAAGALADTLLGRGAKTQQQLREVIALRHTLALGLFLSLSILFSTFGKLVCLVLLTAERAY